MTEAPQRKLFPARAGMNRIGVWPTKYFARIIRLTHGFRSSFRDWAAERTDHPREVIETALAHVSANETW